MVVFVQQGTLLARRLDLERGELTGEPVRLADSVGYDATALGAFSVTKNRIAYRSGAAVRTQLIWFDRSGKAVGHVGEPDPNALWYPNLSPDGRRAAVQRTVGGNADIFLMDLMRDGSLTRFTFDPASDVTPIWSPDGTEIVFSSTRKGAYDLYRKASNMVGAEELLLGTQKIKVPQDWSRDGRFLLYNENDPKSGPDTWALDLNAKEQKPFAVANTAFDESQAQFSPDGHFVTYQTNESGQYQIVVQTFPQATGKWQVSTGGGRSPRWRADGKELYFIAPDGKLMAATVTASGSAFEPGTPVALFQTRIYNGVTPVRPQYAVSKDGRFLINQAVEESTASPITLILNWHPPAK
jgi:dipeptidyl aminopeptidase/acylaminoacyl peptidase